MANEFELLLIVAFGFFLAYMSGSYANRKKLRKLAKTVFDKMSSSWKVGFRPFGHSGLRIKCETKDGDHDFKSLEMSISLVDRENLMHYVLAPFTHDMDKFMLWGVLNKPLRENLELVNIRHKELADEIGQKKRIREVQDVHPKIAEHYKVYSSERDYAAKILSSPRLRDSLTDLSSQVHRISFRSDETVIYMLAELKKDNIMNLIGFALEVGKAVPRWGQ